MKVFGKKIKDQTIFFVLPILGFVFAYIYQYGLFSGFEIDGRFIIPNAVQILKSSVYVGILMFIILVLYHIKYTQKRSDFLEKYILIKFTEENQRKRIRTIINIIFIVLFILFGFYVIRSGLLVDANLLVIILCVIIMFTAIIIKLDHIDIMNLDIIDRIEYLRRMPKNKLIMLMCVIKLALFFMVACLFIYTFGYTRANIEILNNKSVLTTQIDIDKYVIIVNNGDTIYAKQYDTKTGKLSKSFIVIESKNKTYTSEKLKFN